MNLQTFQALRTIINRRRFRKLLTSHSHIIQLYRVFKKYTRQVIGRSYFCIMDISVYCYDDIENQRCGGGGAFRERTVHEYLSSRHSIRFYTGNFPGAKRIDKPNFKCRRMGLKSNYLLSRITFSILATIHSLFSRADIITVEYSIYSPVLTFLFRPKKTIVLFFHVTGGQTLVKYGIFGIFPWCAEKLVLGTAKNFITLTDSMAWELMQRRHNVKAVAGYVNFDSSILSGSVRDEQFVLCLGRIDIRMKGIDILIPAFEKISGQFPDYRLIVAGRGKKSDIEWLQKKISISPCKNKISFINNPSDTDKKNLLHSATIVCMPSRFEGWNIVAIEAAASFKPTVGTRIHGLTDSIRDNETGLLAESENVDDVAEKISDLLKNKKLRDLLGKNGHQWALRFTLDRVAEIQENFYKLIRGNLH
jgi:glycosyltransferase involved in cell wall biosynthesis